MIATSNAFKTAVKAQGRQTAMRVYVPTVSDNVELFGESGSINRAARRKNYPDSDSVPLNEIALLDGSWQLGVKPITSMGATELGFISAKLSDDEGDFGANDRLTILMAAYDNELEEYGLDYFDFKGLAIEFKNDKGGHPTDFSVELMYHDYTRFNYNLTDYDSDYWEMDDLHEDVYRILITIKGWSLPNVHAVISRISFADDIVLTDDLLIKATLIENIGYDDTTGLPTLSNNTLEVEFDKQILDGFIPPKGVTLRAEIGVHTAEDKIEWVPCGEFKLDEYNQSDYEMIAKIKAFDKLYGWGEDTWYCPRENRTAKGRYLQLLGDVDTGEPLNATYYAHIPSLISKKEALARLMIDTVAFACVGKRGVQVLSLWQAGDAGILIDGDDIYTVEKKADYTIRKLHYDVSWTRTYESAGSERAPFEEYDVTERDDSLNLIIPLYFARYNSVIGLYHDFNEDRGEEVPADLYEVYDDLITLSPELEPGEYTVAYAGNFFPNWYNQYKFSTLNTKVARGLGVHITSDWLHADTPHSGYPPVPHPWQELYDEWLPVFWDTVNATRYEYEVTWRGNPALELGDKVRFEDSKGVWRTGYVFSNEYTYEGYLKCKTIIRSDT